MYSGDMGASSVASSGTRMMLGMVELLSTALAEWGSAMALNLGATG
jgi:hypothetical protein